MRKLTMLFSLLLILNSISFAANEQLKDNLIVLMDCSGSMDGNKLVQAKTALRQVLKTLPKNTNFGLLAFGERSGWIYELGPVNEAKLDKAISALRAEGGTPLGTYMKTAADRLLKQRTEQLGYGTYRLLVITDGEANNENPDYVDNYTHQIISKGITVDAIGVFMASNHTLANKVHSYRTAKDAASLEKAISEVLAEITEDDTDNIGQDAFQEIAGLTEESADAILKAYPVYNNQPIENKPIIDHISGENLSESDVDTDTDRGGPSLFTIILILIVIFLMGKAVFSKRRKA
ncbi:MAG: VWA domain-containing protein [Acidobacteria bacterium]|nr:VWA domain-containing protein [Acidobacteriota bacterium]